jgi:hypothetical protein
VNQPGEIQAVTIETLSRRFERFATLEAGGSSPLYGRLCLGIARDPDMLALAAQACNQPVPNLFLAAVHYLLLKGSQHPLAAFYPSVSNDPRSDEDPYPHFRALCFEYRADILNLISTRRVQTNEVRRCAYLVLAFGLVAQRAPDRPLALVDIGASAGLNLLWDRYSYDYGDGRRVGDPNSPVQLACELRGDRHPPIPAALPKVAFRVGLDLNPIDARDPDAVLWFRALIWPEHQERVDRLLRAVQIARHEPPQLIAGDALETLPDVLAMIRQDLTVCLYHMHTINQFPQEARERLSALIAEHGAQRDLYRISSEGIGTPHTQLELVAFKRGVKTEKVLAYVDSHGQWVEWLDTETASMPE